VKNGKKRNDQGELKYVTLPYDFVPFADKGKCHYQYTGDTLPKHNHKERGRLSGIITYKITPCAPLAIEVREKWNGGYFISGSQIRGRVRANLEILSASYPEFIDRSPLLYRDISARGYREKLTGENADIERSIQVGFLRKDGQEFYVIPAQQLGDRNFLSIKEHRLLQMKLGSSGKYFSTLYDWKDNNNLEKLNQLQAQIEQKNRQIKEKREDIKEILSDIQREISAVFIREYSFNKKLRSIRQPDLKNVTDELLEELRKIKSGNPKLNELFQLTAERWSLKAEMHLIYSYRLKRNGDFAPYQENVWFNRTANNGIEKISFAPLEDTPEKGYLFNSTNASSKRSHYFVMGPVKDNGKEYPVPPAVINGYNRNLKKFRITDTCKNPQIKQFYDIFEKYDDIIKSKGTTDGLIVFFNTCYNSKTNAVEIANIGRTPYFKIAHETQLADILGDKEANQVDYANALFGFIADKQEEKVETGFAYKSRLRFSPADIEGTPAWDYVHNLMLMTPYASASAMYLQQPDDKLRTYENKETDINLNGYKYYHVLKRQLKVNPDKENKAIVSSRKLLKHNGIHITGKVYFHNISRQELGLLLLSLDWKELRKSKQYSEYIAEYKEKMADAYELIGGAKPYGYGKVKLEVQNLQIETEEDDFQSLVLEPMKQVNEWYEYIDEFIASMGGQQYFEQVHFRQYIKSKMEVSFDDSGAGIKTQSEPKHINWENINQRGGYSRNLRLKSKATEYTNN